MAYVPVPKDLSKVKTKVAFNLTKRQILCFSVALLMGLPLFFLFKDSAGTSLAAMAMIVVMLPCFLVAMYEKHGQPLEVVVKNIIQTKLTRPKVRPYQTENLYALLEKQRALEKEVSAIVKRTDKKTREAAGNRRKLTRAEKKQIAAVIRQAKGDGKAHTAQQTIPYLAMYPDGICKVAQRKYSKSIAFEDINYQLAQADDKTAIFENWCDFLNYFDASVNVQLSFINQGSQQEQAALAIHIPLQNDDFNSIRTEYSDMLKSQLAKGNNGLVKHKYITFSIEADNPAAARARLSRIETDVLNNFKVLGVSAHPLSGYERLKVLHGVFHPAGEPFSFSYDWLTPTGLTTKDFIAPSSFKFGEGRYFAMGKKTGAVSFLEILAPELNDRILADMLDLETGVIVNLHIKSIDQSEAIKTIKRKITDLDKMKIEEQKKAVRSGYDMDIIPSDLATFGNEAKNLLQDLQSRNERMFLLTFLVVNMTDTKRKLENDIFAAAGIAQKYNCALTRLDYQQEAGLMSSIPLGENLIPIQRGLTTSSTAIFIPFITQELFQTGSALYYGLNALSNNMILCDRKQLKNRMGLSWEHRAAENPLRQSGKSQTPFSLLTMIFLSATRKPSILPLSSGLAGK